MKYLILLSLVLVGFGCASKQKSYCDIVDKETQAEQLMKDEIDAKDSESN
jgi:hypothetical protein